MKTRIILDGNSFYEIDELCLGKSRKKQEIKRQNRKENEKKREAAEGQRNTRGDRRS